MYVTEWFLGIPCMEGAYELWDAERRMYCYWNGYEWGFIHHNLEVVQFYGFRGRKEIVKDGPNRLCNWMKWRGVAR